MNPNSYHLLKNLIKCSLKFNPKFFSLVLVLGFIQSTVAQTRQPITPLKSGDKVLWIGNSYSGFYGPTYDAVNALLKASSPAIENVTFGNKGKGMGIVLEYATWNSLGVIDEIRKGGWSYVVIQSWEDVCYRWGSETLENGTSNPNVVGGRDEAARVKAREVLLANLKILDAEIKKVGAKTLLFEPHPSTWDYVAVYTSSQKTYSEILPNLNCVYAPVLYAWDKVRIDYPTSRYECSGPNSDGFIKMLYSDCGHQNWNGTALDAYTFYTMFTGKSAVGLNPSHEVFSSMNANKAYLAGVGNTIGLQIIALNSADSEAPTAPTNLQTSNIATSSFSLTWNASTDNKGVSSYEIFEGSTSKGITTATSINVTGLKAATTYNITIKAKDAAGNVSIASAVKNVTTLQSTDTQAPTAPTNLSSSAVTTNSFTLLWSAATDDVEVVAYEIFSNGMSIGNTATTSFNLTGLTTSTAYAMTVKARDAANTSVASSTLTVTTLAPDTQAPTAPTNLTVTGLSSKTFTLNWAASVDNLAVVRYEVYMNGELYGNTTGTETNMPVPFLIPATSYNMSVKAKDASGNTSLESSVLKVTTLIADENTARGENTPNESLSKLTDGNLSTKWLDFSATSWVQFASAIGQKWNTYEITSANDAPERDPKAWTISGSNDGIKWIVLDTRIDELWNGRSLTRTFLFTNANAYIFYKWDITANGSGTLIQAAEFKFSNSLLTGNAKNMDSEKVYLYPNPATNQINFKFNNEITNAGITVSDIQGRTLISTVLNSPNDFVATDQLDRGVYFVRVNLENETLILKFIKK